MRGLKVVISYLLAIAGVLLLQLFPYTGIFLMFFLGMLWAAILFNVMLVHLTVDVLRRAVSPAWLVLPIAAYGTWGALAWADYNSATALRATLETKSDAVAMALSKRSDISQNVVVEADPTQNAESLAQDLIKVVDGVRVFANAEEFLLLPTTDPRCTWKRDASYKMFGFTRAKLRRSNRDWTPYDRCVIAVAGEAPNQALMLSRKVLANRYNNHAGMRQVGDDRLFRLYVEDFKLSGRDEERLRLIRRTLVKRRDANGAVEIGSIADGVIPYLWPIPFFVAGCALNDMPSSWDCSFGLWRENMQVGAVSGFGIAQPGYAYYIAEKAGLPLRN